MNYLYTATAVHQYIAWLEVPVYKPLLVDET